MWRSAAVVCAGALLALAQAAVAGATPIVLLSPVAPGTPPPPLSGRVLLGVEPGETRVPGPLRNEEAVRVVLAADGTPASVVVSQRMTIDGKGDFRFVVPGPAVDVRPGAGSESTPGLRQTGIVWQGFSPGRRVLSARVVLRVPDARAGLPLGISVEQPAAVTRVRLENRAVKQFVLTLGSASRRALIGALGRIRTKLSRSTRAGRAIVLAPEQIDGKPSSQKLLTIDAPLHVRGTITVGGRTANVDTMLGAGRPLRSTVEVRGEGRPKISLVVSVGGEPVSLLPSPAALDASKDPLLTLQTALGRIAITHQYQQLLASPTPTGPSVATYRYASAPVVAAAAPSAESSDGGGGPGPLALALIALGGVLGLGGLVVLWAHM